MANILPGARVRLAVGIVVAMPAVCASAGAKVNDDVAFSAATGQTQHLTVTMADDAGTGPVVLYATYRAVAQGTQAAGACAPTIASNTDMRLIDGATAGPAPYSVVRSADLALGLFAVCGYRGVPGGAPASLSSSTVAGTLQSGAPGTGGGGTATATVSLHVRVSRTPGRFVFSGICSRRSGRVSLQRNVGAGFHTVARSQLRAGRYSFTRRAHKGERYRVELAGSKMRSGVVRFR